MKLAARLRWAILGVCAFVSAAGAQVTGPVTTLQTHIEVRGDNISGDMLSSWSLESNRPDTLEVLYVRVAFRDTVGDTTATIIDVTHRYGNGPVEGYRDTIKVWEVQKFPAAGAGGDNQMPDSLFTVVLTNGLPAAGEVFELRGNLVSSDQGYTTIVPFSSSTVNGTLTDTSGIIYIGRGGMDVSFGVLLVGDTTCVTYRALYNTGYGWGFSSPQDTLADSTFTADMEKDAWEFKDAGELLAAPWIKIVRNGHVDADTTTVREMIRVEPR